MRSTASRPVAAAVTHTADAVRLVLLAHNLLDIPTARVNTHSRRSQARLQALGTVVANMAAFGFAPSAAALERLMELSPSALERFWGEWLPAFETLTGADRKMEDFVVYKNFPQEVLDMSLASYWLRQIFMYVGAPNEYFTEDLRERAPLDERLKLKVLAPSGAESLRTLYAGLVANKTRWSEPQGGYAQVLARELGQADLDLADFGFKENGVALMAATLDLAGELTVHDATDVLRLAAAMSQADVSLREAVRLRSFSRGERRLLLELLEGSRNLQADMGLRPALWKQLMAKLHPGDFKYRNVIEAYHTLYGGDITTFNAQVEALLFARDASVLELLKGRPGDFARRLHKLCSLFGVAAVEAFGAVCAQLKTQQLLKLRSYALGVNGRETLIYPPRGNWSRAQFVANAKTELAPEVLRALTAALDAVLRERLAQAFPEGVELCEQTRGIKLATNDQELASYGRGTVFAIPPQVKFVRSASYWKHVGVAHNTWYDNGWNFFDSSWKDRGSCCWNNVKLADAAVFSGDPTNSKDLQGRACQMIDLNLERLARRGVRYAVWSVLCFSNTAFAEANDVLATLQWGESAERGKLYEPARAQMVFALKGTSLTKYVAYLDLETRQLVYMDANLAGSVQSATNNAASLEEKMPAFVEYLASLPSVADLFSHAGPGTTPVLYSDAERAIEPGSRAYVFRPENPDNRFEPVELSTLL